MHGDDEVFSDSRANLQQTWAEVSYRMQAERDNPDTAREQFDAIRDDDDPGLNPHLNFDPAEDIAAPLLAKASARELRYFASRVSTVTMKWRLHF